MARQRIGHAGTELNFARVEHHSGHIDVSFAPDQMRVTYPDVAETHFFAHLRQVNHFLQRLGGEKPDAEFKTAHEISLKTFNVQSSGSNRSTTSFRLSRSNRHGGSNG
jgi:hypothetical protein